MTWHVSKPIAGPNPAKTPVVAVSMPWIQLRALHFADPATGSSDFHYLYFHYLYNTSSTHPDLPGKEDLLQNWASGSKITDPEWEYNRAPKDNFRACFTRDKPVAMRVKLVAMPTAPRSLSGTLSVTPYLDGSAAYLKKPAPVSFTYPAGAAEHWVTVNLDGKMPNEVGRYLMKLKWDIGGWGFAFLGPFWSRLLIYGIYGQPLNPETGVPTDFSAGTLTGTRKRLDHMMAVIGGTRGRHKVETLDQEIDLVWKLHKGVNNVNPPYFYGPNNEYITKDFWAEGDILEVTEQWLGWVRTIPKKRCMDKETGDSRDVSLGTKCDPNKESAEKSWWNDMSCIGHAQLEKTMLAAIGMFARRAWVFPHTKVFPPPGIATEIQQKPILLGTPDSECFALDDYDEKKQQIVKFKHNGKEYLAKPRLMEPDASFEYYEACLLSPSGMFLPGGYPTGGKQLKKSKHFQKYKGFRSAKDLLNWWCKTDRGAWGVRFMCWVSYLRVEGTLEIEEDENHIWDVEGTHYLRYDSNNKILQDYLEIRKHEKWLPPPDVPNKEK